MVEELQLLKEIVGDITGVGIWGFIAYILYSLVKFGSLIGVFGWLANKLMVNIFNHIKAPYTKQECEQFKRDKEEAERKTQDTLHKYKIMKERLENESVNVTD